MIEVEKYNHNHDPADGRFTFAGGGGGAGAHHQPPKGSGGTGTGKPGHHGGGSGKTRYAPSSRRSGRGITVSHKKHSLLCSTLMTEYPDIKAGERVTLFDAKRAYLAEADGYGGLVILSSKKLK